MPPPVFNPFAAKRNNLSQSFNQTQSQAQAQQAQQTSALISNLISVIIQNSLRNRNRFSRRSVDSEILNIGKHTNNHLFMELPKVFIKQYDICSDTVTDSLYLETSDPSAETVTAISNSCQSLTNPGSYSGNSETASTDPNDVILTSSNGTIPFSVVSVVLNISVLENSISRIKKRYIYYVYVSHNINNQNPCIWNIYIYFLLTIAPTGNICYL